MENITRKNNLPMPTKKEIKEKIREWKKCEKMKVTRPQICLKAHRSVFGVLHVTSLILLSLQTQSSFLFLKQNMVKNIQKKLTDPKNCFMLQLTFNFLFTTTTNIFLNIFSIYLKSQAVFVYISIKFFISSHIFSL